MESQNITETKEEYTDTYNSRRMIGLLPMFLLILIVVLRISWTLYKSFGQKTRSPQQRRMYMDARARPSLGPSEPTIYVSPNNLPPPPKYECMAPPSYEEVVGVHYPNYPVQPITQPITAAMAQSSSSNQTVPTTEPARAAEPAPETVITVSTEPKRTSVTVTQS